MNGYGRLGDHLIAGLALMGPAMSLEDRPVFREAPQPSPPRLRLWDLPSRRRYKRNVRANKQYILKGVRP